MKQTILTILIVIALSLAATGCITYNETSDPADPEVVYVTQTPEIVYVTPTPEPTPTPTPIPTPTKVVPIIIPTTTKVSATPTPTPTAMATAEPIPEPTPEWQSPEMTTRRYIDGIVCCKFNKLSWDDTQLLFHMSRGQCGGGYGGPWIGWNDEFYQSETQHKGSLQHVNYIEIFVGNRLIASFDPNISPNPNQNGGYWIHSAVKIQFPPDVVIPEGDYEGDLITWQELKVVGSFTELNLGNDSYGYIDGDYNMDVNYIKTITNKYRNEEESLSHLPIYGI